MPTLDHEAHLHAVSRRRWRHLGLAVVVGLTLVGCAASESPVETGEGPTTTTNGSADAEPGTPETATDLAPPAVTGTATTEPTVPEVTGAAGPTSTDASSATVAPVSSPKGFVDEFDGTSIDDEQWTIVERIGDLSNDEDGCYRPENVAVADGVLTIRTVVDPEGCTSIGADADYSSGMLQWRSYNYTYGTIEVRARVDRSRGPWPAIWLLGTACQENNPRDANDYECNWPEPGADEIDVAEFMRGDFSQVNQQIHSTDGSPQCLTPVDSSDDWHVYGLDWQPDGLTFTIDGDVTCELDGPVSDTPKFLILNVAVGGFGGGDIDPATLPVEMAIDYVRVTAAE